MDLNTVNSLYCGHPRDRELVSLIGSVRNSGSLFQSNVCNLFCRGFSCCPHYRGVRNSEVSTKRELTAVPNATSASDDVTSGTSYTLQKPWLGSRKA